MVKVTQINETVWDLNTVLPDIVSLVTLVFNIIFDITSGTAFLLWCCQKIGLMLLCWKLIGHNLVVTCFIWFFRSCSKLESPANCLSTRLASISMTIQFFRSRWLDEVAPRANVKLNYYQRPKMSAAITARNRFFLNKKWYSKFRITLN